MIRCKFALKRCKFGRFGKFGLLSVIRCKLALLAGHNQEGNSDHGRDASSQCHAPVLLFCAQGAAVDGHALRLRRFHLQHNAESTS